KYMEMGIANLSVRSTCQSAVNTIVNTITQATIHLVLGSSILVRDEKPNPEVRAFKLQRTQRADDN
ncbi:hypothetical protein ACTXT7_009831, partial [Hymenolepis weldensis]